MELTLFVTNISNFFPKNLYKYDDISVNYISITRTSLQALEKAQIEELAKDQATQSTAHFDNGKLKIYRPHLSVIVTISSKSFLK
jgi:hypothetical protein